MPAGADGAQAADVNAVCFFHMLFCLAEISELFFSICQELKLRRPVAVTVTQKDTKESGWAVPPHHRRRVRSIKKEARDSVVQACVPACVCSHTQTHTHKHTMPFPDSQVLT